MGLWGAPTSPYVVESHAEAPRVALGTVEPLSPGFGRAPLFKPCAVFDLIDIGFARAGLKAHGDVEVDQFNREVISHNHVIGFYVPMAHGLAVQVVD